MKRGEERFQKVVEGLGSERTEAKVGAAIMLRTFLQSGYEQFYRQAFDLAVAHLRLRKAEVSAPGPLTRFRGLLRRSSATPTVSIPLDSLGQALVIVFKESFPRARNELEKNSAPFDAQLLDATYVRLDHAYLAGADLAEAWLVRASLREANLMWAQLEGAHLRGPSSKGRTSCGPSSKGRSSTALSSKGRTSGGPSSKGRTLKMRTLCRTRS